MIHIVNINFTKSLKNSHGIPDTDADCYDNLHGIYYPAWRLRDEAEKYKVETFTDYIAKRHREMGKWLRIVGSFTIVFFFFFYVGAQFIGEGKTLENLFGIEKIYGMLARPKLHVTLALFRQLLPISELS